MVIPKKKHVFFNFIKNWFAEKPLNIESKERREQQIQGETIAGLVFSPNFYPMMFVSMILPVGNLRMEGKNEKKLNRINYLPDGILFYLRQYLCCKT
jgi:hypothetical protein